MSHPKISIGLPVYNGAKYLAEAIESVLTQTYADLELVISDNASTDATQEICRSFVADDARVRYFRAETNGGAAWNFNRTFELSQGEYFKWLAHDDVISPCYLQRTLEVLEREPDLVLCHSKTGIINADGDLVSDPGAEGFESWQLQGISREMDECRRELARSSRPHQRYLGILLYSIRNHEMFGLVRREKMAATALHRPHWGGEKVFLAELAVRGPFGEVDEILSFSRWHDERFSANASAEAQRIHIDPTARGGRLRLPRQVRATRGYLQVATQSPIAYRERAACLAMLARFLLQTKKWKNVVRDYVRGVGQLTNTPDASGTGTSWQAGMHWTSLHGTAAALPDSRPREFVA